MAKLTLEFKGVSVPNVVVDTDVTKSLSPEDIRRLAGLPDNAVISYKKGDSMAVVRDVIHNLPTVDRTIRFTVTIPKTNAK